MSPARRADPLANVAAMQRRKRAAIRWRVLQGLHAANVCLAPVTRSRSELAFKSANAPAALFRSGAAEAHGD